MIDSLNDDLIEMSSITQTIQPSIMTAQITPKPFTYDEVYHQYLGNNPYARGEGDPAANVTFSMKLLDIIANSTGSNINITSLMVQAKWQLDKCRIDLVELSNQGNYQKQLSNDAKKILETLCMLDSFSHEYLSNIFRDISRWVATNDERHECVIDAVNDQSFSQLTLHRANNVPLNVPWSQIGETALKISIAAAFPNAGSIMDAGSSTIQTIKLLSDGPAESVTRRVHAMKILRLNNNNTESINCLGSLLSIGSYDSRAMPTVTKLDKYTRESTGYRKLIRTHLMTEVGINLYSGFKKAHIEIPVENKAYDYQGPLYRCMHWSSECDIVSFQGALDDIYAIPILHTTYDEKYYDQLRRNSSEGWGKTLTLNQLCSHVNAILDGVQIKKDIALELVDADLNILHNRLLSIEDPYEFWHINYVQALNYDLTARRHELYRSTDKDYKINLQQEYISDDTFKYLLGSAIATIKYSTSQNPALLQNIIATYNDTMRKIAKDCHMLGSYTQDNRRHNIIPFGHIINDTSIPQSFWEGSTEAYNHLHAGFDLDMKIDLFDLNFGTNICVLDWTLFCKPKDNKTHSLVETWWHGDNKDILSSEYSNTSILSLITDDPHRHLNMRRMVNIIIYKEMTSWKHNTIADLDLPGLANGTIIKYDSPTTLVYQGRLGDIISTSRWITIIPFE